MTRHKSFKRLVRARMAKTGESYTAARAMLDLTGGNKSEAARRLGISRPRLQRLLDGQVD